MKRLITLSVLALLLLASVALLEGAWASKRLTFNSGVSQYPAVAASGAGVYVVWEDDMAGNPEIYFRRSSDSGATWDGAQRITDKATISKRADIAVSGANVYVVWHDDTPGVDDIYFRRSADRGSTWQAAKKITFTAGSSSWPAVAANGANVYVTWIDNTPANNEIYFRRSGDNGATWNPVKRLTHDAGSSEYPAVAVSGADVYLLWSDNTPGNKEIFFRRSANWGLSWEAAQKLSESSGDTRDPAIAAGGSAVYIAGRSDFTGNDEITFGHSEDNGSNWGSAREMTNTAGSSEYPALAADGADVFLSWHDSTPGNYEVYYKNSTDGGVTWGATQRLTNNTEESGLADIAVNATNVYVVYANATGGNGEIYVKYSPR